MDKVKIASELVRVAKGLVSVTVLDTSTYLKWAAEFAGDADKQLWSVKGHISDALDVAQPEEKRDIARLSKRAESVYKEIRAIRAEIEKNRNRKW